MYTQINLEQNDIKIINLLVKCSVRTPVMTNVGLSRKLKRHHYCLEHLNETSYKV